MLPLRTVVCADYRLTSDIRPICAPTGWSPRSRKAAHEWMFGALVMPNGTTVFVFGARASAAGGDTAIVV
jgi:hypothetical protein